MLILPLAPEAAGVAEYIVLAEAVSQVGIAPDGPADQHIPVAVATEAPPVSVATVIPAVAVAVSDISYDAARPPQWGRGIPSRPSSRSSSSSRPPVRDPAVNLSMDRSGIQDVPQTM